VLNLEHLAAWGSINDDDMKLLCRVNTPAAAFEELKKHLLTHHMVPDTAQETKAPGIAKTND